MSSRNLSVLLVEDSRVLAERLRETLLSVPGVQLAGTVDSEADAVAVLQRQPVDVVLLDLHLRQGTGFGVLRAIPTDQAARSSSSCLPTTIWPNIGAPRRRSVRATFSTSCGTSTGCPPCCSRSGTICRRRIPTSSTESGCPTAMGRAACGSPAFNHPLYATPRSWLRATVLAALRPPWTAPAPAAQRAVAAAISAPAAGASAGGYRWAPSFRSQGCRRSS